MSDIRRYSQDFDRFMSQDPTGGWVRYGEHQETIKELERRPSVAKYNALNAECIGRMEAIKALQQSIKELEAQLLNAFQYSKNGKYLGFLKYEQWLERMKIEVDHFGTASK